jgi:hypothetical protein
MKTLLLIVVSVPLLLILWAIVRFSIVSSVRTAGATQRLRSPDLAGASQAVGFAVPLELEEFFRNSPLVEKQECTLVDMASEPPRKWSLGGFYPLTRRDVSERLKIVGLRGVLPIASDLDKGVFAVAKNGEVEHWSPGSTWRSERVAGSIVEFSRFEAREDVG